MKKIFEKVDFVFMLFILALFILMSVFFLSSQILDYNSYILFCAFFFVIVLSFYIKPVIGLVFALLLDITYGIYLFKGSRDFDLISDGIWLIAFPIIAMISGLLGKVLQNPKTYHEEFQGKLDGISQIDKFTGLKTKQKFYTDLLDEAKRKRRSKKQTSVIVIKLLHYDEMVRAYGKNSVDSAILMATHIINKVVIQKDRKYRLDDDTLALIFSYADVNTVRLIKHRISAALDKVSIPVGRERKAVEFEVKVDELDYVQENIG